MICQRKGLHEYYNMGTKKFDFFFSKKFEIEFDLYFDLCWRAEIIQVGLNMHLYVDIGDASSSLWGSTSSYNKSFLLSKVLWLELVRIDAKDIILIGRCNKLLPPCWLMLQLHFLFLFSHLPYCLALFQENLWKKLLYLYIDLLFIWISRGKIDVINGCSNYLTVVRR